MKNGEQFKIDFPPKTNKNGQIFIPYEEERDLPNRRSHKNKPKNKPPQNKTDLTQNQISIDFSKRRKDFSDSGSKQQEFLGLTDEQYLKGYKEAIEMNQDDIKDLYNRKDSQDPGVKKRREAIKNLEKVPASLLYSLNVLERFFGGATKKILESSQRNNNYNENSVYLGVNKRIKFFKKLLEEGKFKEFYEKWSGLRTDGKSSSMPIVLFDIEKNDGTKIDHYRNILESAKTLIEK